MPLTKKMLNDVSVILVALLMCTLSFKAGPLLVVAARTQPTQDIPGPHKSSNDQLIGGDGHSGNHHNPLLVLADPKLNPHLPTPSHHRNVHSSVEASAAGELSTCPPAAPQCPIHAPTPGCCTAKSKQEQQVKANPSLVLADPKPSFHLPLGASAAAERSKCPPAAPQCPPNAPTPRCCRAKSKEANGKAELLGNYGISNDLRKHASGHHSNNKVTKSKDASLTIRELLTLNPLTAPGN